MRTIPLIAIAIAFVLAPAATSQTDEPLSRSALLDRSGDICANALEAVTPHVRGMERADTRREILRHGRRFIRTVRPYVRRLRGLQAQEEPRRYRTFTEELRLAVNWLDASLDAIASGRYRVARRRLETSGDHAARSERAARRYPLRRSCIQLAS